MKTNFYLKLVKFVLKTQIYAILILPCIPLYFVNLEHENIFVKLSVVILCFYAGYIAVTTCFKFDKWFEKTIKIS